MIYAPDYCKDFSCIAGACRHTCCKGWEIDVDDDSLGRFKSHPDIMAHIDGNSVVLDSDERCPFLNNDGLCDMILKHGEAFICDICREHPRFYNEFEDHTEMGLGLVCEEACRLILDKKDDFKLIPARELSSEIKMIFDTSAHVSQRLKKLKPSSLSSSTRASFLKTLEVMDPVWTSLLDKMISSSPDSADEKRVIDKDPRRFSNLCAYYLYRYPGTAGFAVEATYTVADLVCIGIDIHEAARLFSGEVEYSDINIDSAIDYFL
ncbi:MAG: flagellin lysine-N-methylase [Clostridiales bacterium]|nr:flagellin lysine-N-methylase [Clostridiales bacterium]